MFGWIKWIGFEGWMDGSPGGVKYRAPYGAYKYKLEGKARTC